MGIKASIIAAGSAGVIFDNVTIFINIAEEICIFNKNPFLFGDKTIFIHIIHVLAVFYKLFLDYFAIFIQIVTVSGITVGYECRSSRGSETVFVKIIISAVNFYTLLIHKNFAVFIDIKLLTDPAGYFEGSVRLMADIISILIAGKIILLLLLIYSDLTACSCKFVDGFIIGNKKDIFDGRPVAFCVKASVIAAGSFCFFIYQNVAFAVCITELAVFTLDPFVGGLDAIFIQINNLRLAVFRFHFKVCVGKLFLCRQIHIRSIVLFGIPAGGNIPAVFPICVAV